MATRMNTRKGNMLKWSLAFLFIVIPALAVLTQVFYLHFESGSITFQQALLFVVESMTSTGYGELLPFHSWGMILFTVLLVFGGFGGLFIIFTTIATEYVHEMMGKAMPKALPAGMKGHVAIIGDDQTTVRLANMALAAGLAPAIMSRDRDFVSELLDRGLTGIHGDPSRCGDLAAFGVDRASAVVTVQRDDRNVNTVLAVKTLSPRVPIYATVDNPNFRNYMDHAGAAVTLQIKKTLGDALARWVSAPVPETLAQATMQYPGLHFMELPVTPISPFANKRLSDLQVRDKTGVTILGVWKADSYIRTASPETTFESGDVILVMAAEQQIKAFESVYGPGLRDLKRPKPGDGCIIVGGGHVGEQVYRELKAVGMVPTVVEDRPVPLDSVLKGDGTKPDVLVEAGIMRAAALAVCTNGDLECLMTVLVARSLRPDMTIVARSNSDEYGDRLLMAGADFSISLSRAASQRLLNLITPNPTAANATEFMGATIPAPASMVGKQLGDIRLFNEFGCTVAVIDSNNGDTVLNPDGGAGIPAGSVLTILGEPNQLQAFIDRLNATEPGIVCMIE